MTPELFYDFLRNPKLIQLIEQNKTTNDFFDVINLNRHENPRQSRASQSTASQTALVKRGPTNCVGASDCKTFLYSQIRRQWLRLVFDTPYVGYALA